MMQRIISLMIVFVMLFSTASNIVTRQGAAEPSSAPSGDASGSDAPEAEVAKADAIEADAAETGGVDESASDSDLEDGAANVLDPTSSTDISPKVNRKNTVPGHVHDSSATTCNHPDCAEKTVVWEAWTSTTSLPGSSAAGTHYYLTGDIELAARETITTAKTIHLCLNGYTVNGRSAVALYATNNSGANLYITDCNARFGADGKLITGSAGKLTGGKNDYAGAVQVMSGKVMLENIDITGNATGASGGTVYARNAGASVIIKNARIAENTATSGGAVRADNGSVTIENTLIELNTVTATGGGIYVPSASAALTVSNTIIRNNTAVTGGGAVYLKNASATLKSTTIRDNQSTTSGGTAIHLDSANVSLDDCTVTENNNSASGTAWRGAVYSDKKNDSITLSGKTVIDNNIFNNGASEINLRLQRVPDSGYAPITADGLSGGSSISVLAKTGSNANNTFADSDPSALVKMTAKQTSWNHGWIVLDNIGKSVEYDVDGTKTLFYAEENHRHCLCGDGGLSGYGGHGTGCDGAAALWLPWNDGTTLPVSGRYYLTQDVTLTAQVILTSDLTLCLNNHTITQTGEGARIFYIQGTSTLSICDCKASTSNGSYNAGRLTGGAASCIFFYWNNAQTLNLYDGIITGNSRPADNGGGVCIQRDDTFNMYGGRITGNTAAKGSAVALTASSSVFNMYGGTISENDPNGAVYFENGTVAVRGGAVVSKNGGNGVYIGSTAGACTLSEAPNADLFVCDGHPGINADGFPPAQESELRQSRISRQPSPISSRKAGWLFPTGIQAA